MVGSDGEESGRPGKRRAEVGNLGAGPSCWRRDGGEDFHLAAEDPLLVFGSEIMTIILGMLDMRSVAEARLVSRGWQAVASSDRIWESKDFFLIYRSSPCVYLLWESGIASHGGLIANANWRKDGNKEPPACFLELINDRDLHLKNQRLFFFDALYAKECQELWSGKAHIPRISMVEGLPKMVACLLSIKDGKRTRITRDDLCDHVWEFRFTESAPEYWRDLDPYWRGSGETPMRRYFHPDGSITADPDDKVWGGHESSYTIVTGLLADGQVREHYVRINRWPKMTVERQPDWSWMLKNHLYCYKSIGDADRSGGTGPSVSVAAATGESS